MNAASRAWLIVCCLLLSASTVRAADDDESKIDPKAEEVLRASADFYRGLKSFKVDLDSTLRMETPDEKNEMAAKYTLAIDRPARLAIRLLSGEMGATIVSNGKELFTSVPALKKYVIEDAPKSVDDVLGSGLHQATHLTHGSVFTGFGMLFRSPGNLMQGIDDARLLDSVEVDGQRAHHVRVSLQKKVSWDLWIAAGDKPLLLRLKPDLAKALAASAARLPPGLKMELVANFTNWKVDPPLSDADFKFKEPDDAEKVDSIFGAPRTERHALLGKPAPDFELAELNGKKIKLSAHRGKVVILDFWATWCGPCVAALPTIAEVAQQYAGKGVAFYAINEAEESIDVRKFLDEKDLDLPVLLDSQGKVGELYRVEAIPQTVLVGKDGTVEVVHVGLSENLKDQLTKELDDLLAGKKLSEQDHGDKKPTAEKPGSD
jgi:peroxiredoxin